MWKYEKKLQYPVNIKKKNLQMAKCILTQYGGPAGELAASWQYLDQRYNMPDDRGKALLTDIGTEELAHVEIISAMLYQLMKGATKEELKAAGLDGMYSQFGRDLFPSDSFGNPFNMTYIKVSGDYIADIESDMGAEQRARATYEHLMDLTDDPDILGPLAFLRQREIIHYQRFKELRDYYLKMNVDQVAVTEPNLLIVDKEKVPAHLDFNKAAKLNKRMDYVEKHDFKKTIDDTFIFSSMPGKIILQNNDIKLDITTDCSSLNIYVDNSLTPVKFKARNDYSLRRGIALEPQRFILNKDEIILHKGEVYKNYIDYKFKAR